ncbi:esterase, partial [Streptomyces sp. NPDC052016]
MSCVRLNGALLFSTCRRPRRGLASETARGTRTQEVAMTDTTAARPVLEPAAQSFAEATANPPYLFDLGPTEGRRTVDEVQSGEIDKPAVDEEWITVSGGPTGSVRA